KTKFYRFDKEGNRWKERTAGTVKFPKNMVTSKFFDSSVLSDSLIESDNFNSLNEEDISEALAVARVFPVEVKGRTNGHADNGCWWLYMKPFVFFSIEGVKEYETRWIGWAGVNVSDGVGQKALTKALAEMFPFGIDSDRFIRFLKLPEVQEHMKELKERFSGRK
ncbi:hypothetical protein S83_054967, partial [Arachis hypogaea]